MSITFSRLTAGWFLFFFFQAEDGIRDYKVTGVQTCALPIFVQVDRGKWPARRWRYRLRFVCPTLSAASRHWRQIPRGVHPCPARGRNDIGRRSTKAPRCAPERWFLGSPVPPPLPNSSPDSLPYPNPSPVLELPQRRP